MGSVPGADPLAAPCPASVPAHEQAMAVSLRRVRHSLPRARSCGGADGAHEDAPAPRALVRWPETWVRPRSGLAAACAPCTRGVRPVSWTMVSWERDSSRVARFSVGSVVWPPPSAARGYCSRLMPTLDRATLRVTGHRRTLTAILAGLPVVQLTTIGAKTGMPHTVSVLGFPTRQGVVVAAGNFGHRTEPAWCANLRRNPRARLEQGRLTRPVVAHELSGNARAAAWRQCLTVYPDGAEYARRAAPRVIAQFLLDPECDT